MARLNRCTCGRMPHLRARKTREGMVITSAACPNLRCGAQGLPVEDFERNDAAAAAKWNRHGGRKAA
ncbi:hypothetical protein [Sphingobium sp. IP1]|uniref:hypothetical protein n=1 Tax=Sphingobium sp. IP1 TaxID=2021637 RepID=UPI00117AD276|nr:hypothetical protein [Sphingobium sp. IP1]